ncbi:hypothetical protein GCM10008992_05110 [Halorubrum aquaticum]
MCTAGFVQVYTSKSRNSGVREFGERTVRTVTIPLPDLNEFERIQGTVKLSSDLGLNRSGVAVDGNRGERVLSEEVTGCEARRCDDDDIRSIDVVKRELGISVLDDSRIQFIDGKEEASIPIFDTRPRRLKMPFEHNYIEIYALKALTLW